MKDVLPFVSLVLSLAAFSISFLTYRRAREREARESRASALDLALSQEVTLSNMYTSLLTLDKSKFRPGILETLVIAQNNLPKLIEKARDLRERVESEENLEKIHTLQISLRSLCANCKSLSAGINHGIEHGKST